MNTIWRWRSRLLALAGVLATAAAIGAVQANPAPAEERALPSLPELPQLPQLPALPGAGTGGGGQTPGQLPSVSAPQGGVTDQLGDLPVRPEWLVNTLGRATKPGEVKNNATEGAIESRDKAKREWKEALAAFKAGNGEEPSPLARPEYSVVWSSKQNAADVNADVVSKFIQNLTVNPQGLTDLLNPQFLPGLDGFQVIDQRKQNVDGSENPDYGKVVNFVQLPLPWGFENEAHHMQYEWEDGDPILAGGLYTGTTFVLDPTDVPNLKLTNTIDPTQNPNGSIADAYEKHKDGRFVLTLMGGPLSNFGGSPGQLITFKPDKTKGMVKESEVSAGNVGGTVTGNAGGIKEPCDVRESGPVPTGTCANPHGIQFRPDLNVGLTSDYAEPRQIVLDPVKTVDKYVFRPTIRSWDISNSSKPKLQGVAKVPQGPQKPAQRAHDQRGMMEDAKTWPDAKRKYNGIDSKGYFASSMCGGGVFFVPDITKAKGDFSNQINQVWNDGLSALALDGDSKFEDEPNGCPGGAWHQVTPNNKLFFRAVQGRNPGGDNYFDQGAAKMLYSIDISPLTKSAQDGEVLCDLSRGIHKEGYNLTGMQVYQQLARGKEVADCPKLVSTLKVKDPTSGGPHWGALDNQSYDENGVPWRLTFSNYFVSRTGVDGDHRFYTVDVSPKGKLSYDDDYRDENTGALGVNFNRRDWPGSPDAGFYKPHSMLWVCPPGICPKDAAPSERTCAVTDGGLSSDELGRVGLGRSRSAVRKQFPSVKKTKAGGDRFCTSDGGATRVTYAKGKAVAVFSSSNRYKRSKVAAGSSSKTLQRSWKVKGKGTKVGTSRWFVKRSGKTAYLAQVRGGKVKAVGIARRSNAKSTKQTNALLRKLGK